jgi:hypothetical protein
LWEEIRESGIEPEYHSGYSDDLENRLDFLEGCRLMGFALVPLADQNAYRATHPFVNFVQPQQLQLVDTLGTGLDSYAVEVPRRASKTTTLFMLLIGRCARRAGYQVTFSAQSGVAGSRRLREWASRLDKINPPDDLGLPPWLRNKPRPVPAARARVVALFGDDILPPDEAEHATGGRGFKVMRGEVGKGIYFDNGSTFLVLKPDADSYRGEAADCSWIDEAQEVDPDEGDELLAGILPLQDTKEGAHIILSGTAGEIRVGPFWTYIDRGRTGCATKRVEVGIIDFAAPEDTPWEVVEDEDSAMELLARVHPGVGTLTTLDKMRKNYRALPRPQWAREYLSLWPETFGVTTIAPALWASAEIKRKDRPARVAFGIDTRPGGSATAIVAAWRDGRGTAYLEVVAHQSGTLWAPQRMADLTTKYRGSSVAYDDIGEGKATATEAQNLRPRPRMRIQTYREHAAGCVQFMRDLERGRLKHFGQVSLDEAVAIAGKREVRGDSGVWLWTAAVDGDIAPLVAATRALRNWDQHMGAQRATTAKPVIAQ